MNEERQKERKKKQHSIIIKERRMEWTRLSRPFVFGGQREVSEGQTGYTDYAVE